MILELTRIGRSPQFCLFIGCATALPMGVAPESMFDCLQSCIDSSWLASCSSCICLSWTQPVFQPLLEFGQRLVEAESERDLLRKDLKKAQGNVLDLSLFFFPCGCVEFRLIALRIFAESANRAELGRADAAK